MSRTKPLSAFLVMFFGWGCTTPDTPSPSAEATSTPPASTPASVSAAEAAAKVLRVGPACGAGGPNEACCEAMHMLDLEKSFSLAQGLGTDVAPFMFDNAVFASADRVRVVKGGQSKIGEGAKMGLMDYTGALVVPFEWTFIDIPCRGVARACKDCTKDCAGADCEHWSIKADKWLCIDEAGAEVACPSDEAEQ